MAFDHDAKLFDVLANGYHLNTQLQALLGGRPLDSLGQQEAMAFSQELSRVFKVSMSMLNSNTVTRVRTAPEIRTGNSSGVIIQAAKKDKRARSDSGEVVTPVKKSREDGVTRKEITASPYKDGYEWRKYGQKNIKNCNFVRYYFRCSRDRRCEAKKKVQQQDGSRGQLSPPMFEVTYVNEHTCHVLRAIANGGAARMAASPRTTNRPYRVLGVVDAARDDGGVLFDDLSSSFPRIGAGGSAQENETIVSCLADVIRGAAPSPLPSPWPPAAEAGASEPAAASPYVPPPMQASAGHSASVGVAEDGGAMTTMMIDDTDFCWDPSPFCAVGEADQDQLMMDHRDMHVDAARLADTEWPRHPSAGAWR
ncbi:transcription factor WRKY45-1-like [Miscanthus floridulus]|uniref:transcription factor WRKY45-1-like n=1 Tax=Miscanthus floridulus TaxID=154761 RepID=UPI003459040D